MEKFNLSEKRILVDKEFAHYVEEDVKEFIKLLKRELLNIGLRGNKRDGEARQKFLRKIDKLAGDKLK